MPFNRCLRTAKYLSRQVEIAFQVCASTFTSDTDDSSVFQQSVVALARKTGDRDKVAQKPTDVSAVGSRRAPHTKCNGHPLHFTGGRRERNSAEKWECGGGCGRKLLRLDAHYRGPQLLRCFALGLMRRSAPIVGVAPVVYRNRLLALLAVLAHFPG